VSGYRNLKDRVRNIEQGRGTNSVVFTFSDGSRRSFSFSRADRASIMVAAFARERARRKGEDFVPRNARADEVAQLIRKATSVRPMSRFWLSAGLGADVPLQSFPNSEQEDR